MFLISSWLLIRNWATVVFSRCHPSLPSSRTKGARLNISPVSTYPLEPEGLSSRIDSSASKNSVQLNRIHEICADWCSMMIEGPLARRGLVASLLPPEPRTCPAFSTATSFDAVPKLISHLFPLYFLYLSLSLSSSPPTSHISTLPLLTTIIKSHCLHKIHILSRSPIQMLSLYLREVKRLRATRFVHVISCDVETSASPCTGTTRYGGGFY